MSEQTSPKRRKYVPVVGPRLKRLLAVIFGLFAVLVVNSIYLVSVTVAGTEYQNWFYLNMFWVHLVLGMALVIPVIVFGTIHIRNARNRPNKRAIRAGYSVYIGAILIFISGFVLTRDIFGFAMDLNNPAVRSTGYWVHVITPLVVVWLYVLHRLAGRRIKWKVGLTWSAAAGVFAAVMVLLQMQDPRAWNQEGPESGEQYFFPSLTRTSDGNFIPAEVLNNDEYCLQCHEDIHDQWLHSAHKFASFNNPVYEFSVKATRKFLNERDGNVQGARFCAGCHDPVPFLSGAFDHPKFDDPNYDLASDPTAQAGITCTTCHAISHVNSVRGNADYTITEPVHYPFTFSESPVLQWVNRQLVKAKPAFHKATFLKPLHQTTEFCSVCHKVNIPEELNDYKWLRGQNHHDAFWLSGVSGFGVTSFYYPKQAQANCNQCHLPLVPVSDDGANFAARVRDDSGIRKVMGHQFPSANTGIVHLKRNVMRDPDAAIEAHKEFNDGVMRVDIFAVREGGHIDDPMSEPIRPVVPALEPGKTYLIETIIRTLKMGHMFTQGTVDSNEVWLEVTARSGDRVIGVSGHRDPVNSEVDPWAHFVNAFVIDRNGNQIDARNVQDIFVPLYNNQIPPGAADIVHGRLDVPGDVTEPITVSVRLLYRKFHTALMRHVMDDPDYVNDLPIMVMAEDSVTFPIDVEGTGTDERQFPEWQRWNDYGIAMLRSGQLRQAQEAFERVELSGLPDGPLNLARVYIQEGLIQEEAPAALERAANSDPPANAWSLLWFGAEVAARNGDHDRAISNLEDLLRGGFEQAEGRNFDFEKDYRVHNALGSAYFQRGLRERNEKRRPFMVAARDAYLRTLELEPENLAAHYGLRQVFQDLGEDESAAHHERLHAKYKPDDNATDEAIAKARIKYPAANAAAENVVIYDLRRPGAYGLPAGPDDLARRDD